MMRWLSTIRKLPGRGALRSLRTRSAGPALGLAVLLSTGALAAEYPGRTVREIREEATRSNQDKAGRPLPLAAHWNVGGPAGSFDMAYQLGLLSKGRHILPWFGWPPTDRWLEQTWKPGDPARQKHMDAALAAYEAPIRELARLQLPLSFVSTQWESTLSYDKAFLGLPPDQNPNVVSVEGKVLPKVSPFGPVEPWKQCGRQWTDSLFMKKFQEWYPEPPLVVLVSNNEHAKLGWTEVETSQRYMDKYGKGRSDDFKRQVVGDGYLERYRALLDGVREGFGSGPWRKAARCVGYEAFGPVHFGRWAGWKEYSSFTPGRLDWSHLCWDGGSPSYYLHDWMAITDYTVWSPQVESMNWVFMQQDVWKTAPEYWFEISTWDGDQPGAGSDKRLFFATKEEVYTPARYEGLVQFGMWLLRPRLVREFRGWLETIAYAGPYFDAILDAVDRVYADKTLRRFWRQGRLVPNRQHAHPYQSDVPKEYKDAERWFLLDTSLSPRELTEPREFDNLAPPPSQTEVPVFALALVLGDEGEREWLVYAHAPRGARTGVTISVPGFGDFTADVPQSGSFYLLKEDGRKVRPVAQGGPADVTLHVNGRYPARNTPVSLSTSDCYNPQGKLSRFTWDFGDGATAEGEKVEHSFCRRGQYIVTLSAAGDGGATVEKQLPLFAGYRAEEGLVCRFLMKGATRQHVKSWVWRGGWEKLDYSLIPDAACRGHTGFLVGGQWVEDPERGNVLELGGKTDRVTLVNTPDINTAPRYKDRTVALWFKAAALASRQVLYEEGGPGAGLNVYLDREALYGGAWNLKAWPGTWLKCGGLAGDSWHHVALVLRDAPEKPEAGHLLLFVDGKQVQSGGAASLSAHSGGICIGWAGNTLYHDGKAGERSDAFAGRVSDLLIFNRVLTEAEVKALATPP